MLRLPVEKSTRSAPFYCNYLLQSLSYSPPPTIQCFAPLLQELHQRMLQITKIDEAALPITVSFSRERFVILFFWVKYNDSPSCPHRCSGCYAAAARRTPPRRRLLAHWHVLNRMEASRPAVRIDFLFLLLDPLTAQFWHQHAQRPRLRVQRFSGAVSPARRSARFG